MNKPIFKSSNAQGEGLLGGCPEGGRWRFELIDELLRANLHKLKVRTKAKKLERSKESQAIKTVAQQVLVFQGR